MRNLVSVIIILLLISILSGCKNHVSHQKGNIESDPLETMIADIWNNSTFKNEISFQIFKIAMKGYYHLDGFKSGKISIIDYSKPSTDKRLFVIDLNLKNLVFHTYVAHGKNTGENNANKFSNKPNSNMSSLGFYKTAETYYGKNGYSLRLDGLEKGINNKARDRSIVMHGANYVSKNFIDKYGKLGRSLGCPALPVNEAEAIINSIANGYCLFIYGKDKTYSRTSKIK